MAGPLARIELPKELQLPAKARRASAAKQSRARADLSETLEAVTGVARSAKKGSKRCKYGMRPDGYCNDAPDRVVQVKHSGRVEHVTVGPSPAQKVAAATPSAPQPQSTLTSRGGGTTVIAGDPKRALLTASKAGKALGAKLLPAGKMAAKAALTLASFTPVGRVAKLAIFGARAARAAKLARAVPVTAKLLKG